MQLLLDSEGAIVGTFVREPDGAKYLYYSTELWNDGTSALRAFPGDFSFVLHEAHRLIPAEAVALKPGEFLRYHGSLNSLPLAGNCGCACDSDCECR